MAEVNRCLRQEDSAIAFLEVQPLFDEMQLKLRERPSEPLAEPFATMKKMLDDTVRFDSVGSSFDPVQWEGAFEEGESTIRDLVYARGFQAAEDYVTTLYVGALLGTEVEPPIRISNIDLNLEFECQAQHLDAIQELCSSSPDSAAQGYACFSLAELPDRDVEVIAQVCKELPYFLVCQPDDPPPMTYEQATGEALPGRSS